MKVRATQAIAAAQPDAAGGHQTGVV